MSEHASSVTTLRSITQRQAVCMSRSKPTVFMQMVLQDGNSRNGHLHLGLIEAPLAGSSPDNHGPVGLVCTVSCSTVVTEFCCNSVSSNTVEASHFGCHPSTTGTQHYKHGLPSLFASECCVLSDERRALQTWFANNSLPFAKNCSLLLGEFTHGTLQAR